MTDKPFQSPQEALAHFGVKGMKWGVRKDRDKGGSSKGNLFDQHGNPKKHSGRPQDP